MFVLLKDDTVSMRGGGVIERRKTDADIVVAKIAQASKRISPVGSDVVLKEVVVPEESEGGGNMKRGQGRKGGDEGAQARVMHKHHSIHQLNLHLLTDTNDRLEASEINSDRLLTQYMLVSRGRGCALALP